MRNMRPGFGRMVHRDWTGLCGLPRTPLLGTSVNKERNAILHLYSPLIGLRSSPRSFLSPMCRPAPTALLVARDKLHHGRRLRLYFTNENDTELYYERQEDRKSVV